MVKKLILCTAICVVCGLCYYGCGQAGMESEESKMGYEQISQDEARLLMAESEDRIILDVRTKEEYAEGHIPGAICVPNETIGTEMPKELPDKEQLILVYCRSGNRSKKAAEKLVKIGYTNIKEFGGIITWNGYIEK